MVLPMFLMSLAAWTLGKKCKIMSDSGKLIVIEGIDGTGKSTQVTMLAKALRALGHKVEQSFEPTNGFWGKKLRDSATTGRLSIEEELAYFIKDRKQHVEELIKPTIASSGIAVLDRYYFSSMAYQGARGINPQQIRQENEVFAPQPDILIILDLPVDKALARIGVRDGEANEFEQRESLQYCRDMFLSLQNELFAHVISADQSIEEVHQAIIQTVNSVLS